MAETDIILIGPMSAGKTTQAELLSARLNRPVVEVDALRWQYYAEIGYDKAVAKERRESGGILALVAYWKPFEIHAVERMLADHQNCIFSFGGGHSVYEDDALFERVKRALAPYKNVVLLRPSPDDDESMNILLERMREEDEGDVEAAVVQLNEHFLTHHSNADLATITVYTKGKTPDETCEDILAQLRQ
jgi:shikimate kinase